MSRLAILTPTEKRRFIAPPQLSREERSLFFRIDADVKKTIRYLKTPESKIGYILQLGYFKAKASFYTANQFKKRDVEFVKRKLNIAGQINMSSYKGSALSRHRRSILTTLGWEAYGDRSHALISEHAVWLSQKNTKPAQLLMALVDFCWKSRFEIPAYTELAEIITSSFRNYETKLLDELEKRLSSDDRQHLQQCLVSSGNDDEGLTALKKIGQSLKPMEIKRSVEVMQQFGHYFHRHKDSLSVLSINDQTLEYFATWVIKAQTFQLKSFANPTKGYLYLLCFIKHQYYERNDNLVDIFLKSVAQTKNQIRNYSQEIEQNAQKERDQAIDLLAKSHKSVNQLFKEISIIVKQKALLPNERLRKIEQLVNEHEKRQSEKAMVKLQELEDTVKRARDQRSYYEALSALSIKLQNRVSEIVKSLQFDAATSKTTLIRAINYFQLTDGKLGDRSPLDFLSKHEKTMVTENDALNRPLYKALLFLHMFSAIKSGDLNLVHSYRYKSVQDYLISSSEWRRNRRRLLQLAGLSAFEKGDQYLDILKSRLDEYYENANEHHLLGKNPYLSIRPDGRVTVKTPKTDYDQTEFIANTLTQEGFVPVLQVLREIEGHCQFTRNFTHHSNKHVKMKPALDIILAGIIDKGCNIGTRKLAGISVDISENVLRNTINWCFDLKNIQAANKAIIATIDKLALANSYKHDNAILHSSSDGKKMNVAVESLLANYSFKYFGKEKGVSIYTFIDERQALFHSTVMSASDREAPYVIDGLLHNNVKESRIHSTDTHGFSETVFAATHFIDVAFAPRFKRVGHQTLYSFSTKKTHKKRGHVILPSRTINRKLIEENWDDILRFMATIKLGHTTASQLFKRLSSYAKDHPLYKALKEFGRIIKSQYILTYFDDIDLRQRVQKQLNRVELSNRFSDAVFFDSDKEFQVGTKEEQEIATGCKVLIQNAIILWNYLYLSELVMATENEAEKAGIIESIKQGSVITWRHVNMRGEYDFTKRSANDAQFDFDKILSFKIR